MSYGWRLFLSSWESMEALNELCCELLDLELQRSLSIEGVANYCTVHHNVLHTVLKLLAHVPCYCVVIFISLLFVALYPYCTIIILVWSVCHIFSWAHHPFGWKLVVNTLEILMIDSHTVPLVNLDDWL